MGGSHDAFIESRDIHIEFVERHILLRVSPDEVMKLQPSDGQHRHVVELGIVESVQEMDAARTRGSQAYPQPSRELGVTAGHKGGCLFMAHLNKSNFLLVGSKRLHDPVDAVPRESKNDFNAPIDQGFNQHIRRGHKIPPSPRLNSRIKDANPKRVVHLNWKESLRKITNLPWNGSRAIAFEGTDF